MGLWTGMRGPGRAARSCAKDADEKIKGPARTADANPAGRDKRDAGIFESPSHLALYAGDMPRVPAFNAKSCLRKHFSFVTKRRARNAFLLGRQRQAFARRFLTPKRVRAGQRRQQRTGSASAAADAFPSSTLRVTHRKPLMQTSELLNPRPSPPRKSRPRAEFDIAPVVRG